MDTDTDLKIWIQAAIPPRPDGSLDRDRAAKRLGISTRTLRRWLAHPESVPLTARKRLLQLAILRGHGHILWPAPPADVLDRDSQLAEYAVNASFEIAAGENLDFWAGPRPERLKPHNLLMLHYPRAHAYCVTTAQDAKALAKIKRTGAQIITQQTFANYWAAQAIKMSWLEQHRDLRCVVPRELIPISRTHLWREA